MTSITNGRPRRRRPHRGERGPSRERLGPGRSTDRVRGRCAVGWIRGERGRGARRRAGAADASVDHTSITPKRATTSLAASVDPTESRKGGYSRRALTVLPTSALGKAATYARNQWAALRVYASDGRLTIDDNVSERTLRLQAIEGRIGSSRGVRRRARGRRCCSRSWWGRSGITWSRGPGCGTCCDG
jgi:hypothetical protein